ncbi:MAG: metal-dependent hydrolase [Nanoarchaeota archaeon]|nr:metal-dependent hydrolase [Nanoarchaeota archaeon]
MGNYHEHLFIGFIVAGILSAILYFIFHVNVFGGNFLITNIIVVFIFSLLPDVDNKSARISWLLHFASVLAVLAVILKAIPFNFSSILILLSLLILEIYHWTFAKDSWDHRHFPHTFTFGAIASLILFIITLSWISTLIGILAFSSHIFLDGHMERTIKADRRIWKSIFSKIKRT